ncbi:AAA family ATPase [Paracoccus sp. 08]|uniref:AAA family ATPase n=1 Tax=Paracoccus sp. 08 TaxID=2606624 RepID=UPI0020948E03|nr:AAA family ATPase [Paracoccus sp. 08]
MFEDTSSDALDVPVAGAIRILPPPTPAAMKRVEEFCFSALPADAAKPRLTQNHLIEGILQHPSLAVLYGPPGAGKTFYALGMAHAVASGEAFGEHKVRQGAVIYISAEGTGGIENRLAAIPGPRSPKLVVLRSQVDLYSSDADASAIVAYAQRVTRTQGKVGLIVIDTLAQCFGGGDENTAADMGVVLNRIAAIKDTLGATVVIIHHTGKDTERGARGSSTLPAKAETVLEVRREGDHIEVRATKQRDLELGWKHYFCLETVELGLDDGRRRVTSCHIKFVEGNSSVTAKAGGFAQAAVLKLLPAFLAAFGTEYRLSEGCDAGGLIQKADREAFRRYALSLSASDFKGKLTPRNVNEAISSLLKRGVLQGSGDEIWLKA